MSWTLLYLLLTLTALRICPLNPVNQVAEGNWKVFVTDTYFLGLGRTIKSTIENTNNMKHNFLEFSKVTQKIKLPTYCFTTSKIFDRFNMFSLSEMNSRLKDMISNSLLKGSFPREDFSLRVRWQSDVILRTMEPIDFKTKIIFLTTFASILFTFITLCNLFNLRGKKKIRSQALPDNLKWPRRG